MKQRFLPVLAFVQHQVQEGQLSILLPDAELLSWKPAVTYSWDHDWCVSHCLFAMVFPRDFIVYLNPILGQKWSFIHFYHRA